MKQIALWATAGVVAVIGSGCGHKQATEDDALLPVDVAEVLSDSVVLYKEYPGTLHARSSVDIVARVDGYLRSQNYQDGAMVEKGQVLFTIEPTQYQDAVKAASAQLTTARSNYEYASRQYEAVKKALESDAVSQMEVLQSKSNMESAEAAIKSAEAQLRTAETNLGYCTIRAPFSGMVTASGPSVGAFVGGGAAPVTLATIYDNSQLRADFFVEDASYLGMTADGGAAVDYGSIPVRFNEALPHSYYGKLEYMSPDVNTSTGTIQLRALLDNKYGELRDGMYATVALPYRVEPHATIVKDASISTDQLGKYIYVVNDSDKVVYTPVIAGDLVRDSMRVVTGVAPGARYVTKALLKVRAGMKVKPVNVK